jgi:hypothetical protein
MVKNLLKLFPVILVLLLFAAKIQAQSWSALGPDDNNEAFSGLIKYNNIVTSPDGVPYVVSSDANNLGKLTVKKFDSGSWVTLGVPGFSGGANRSISLAINGVTPYVAFSDVGNDGKATVMKYDGSNWVTVGVAGFSTNTIGDLSLSFNGSTPYVAYGGTVQRFDGNNWVMVGASGFSTTSASGVVLSFDNDIPYVAYLDYVNTVYRATVKKFVGSSWITVGTPEIITGTVAFYEFVFYRNTPFLAYTLDNNDHRLSVKIFNGDNWAQLGSTNITTESVAYISIASNGTPYVAYADGSVGGKASVKKYNGQSWVTVGVEGFSAGYADYTSIALSGNTPYIAFENLDTKKGTVMMFNGSSWVVAGSSGNISNGAGTFTSLAFNNNIPYLAYTDAINSNKATVKKYDGSSWATVGAAGFSVGQTINNSLVFNENTPYLSYSDNSNSSKATVMRFDGSNWIAVGPAGFSSGTASYVSLAFSGATPYVAYGDYGNLGKVTVKKFDGNSWQTVGVAGFSAGAVNSLAFGLNGTNPYVAYADNSNGGKLTVMKFNGTIWTMVGTPNFSAGTTTAVPLAYDGNTFYVAYPDPSASNKLTVKKFDGSSWINVGAAGLSAGGASYVNFAFNGNTPYVGYADAVNSNKMTVKQFYGNNWITLGTPGFSAEGINNAGASLAVDNNKVYVAYDLDGLYVKSFANPTSSNAQLSNLTLNSVTLSPAFAAGITSYTALVPNTTSSITLTSTTSDSNASVKVNGTTVTFGSTSATIPLIVGNNTITTVVTAQDGTTTKTYTLTVNRTQAAQTITFATFPAKTYGDADFVIGASSSSGLPVSYTTSNQAVAIVTANGLIHLVSAGTTNITASQVGSADYLAATDVVQTLTVAQPQNPGQVLTWKPLGPDDNNIISSAAVTYTNTVTDANGVPYIAFSDSDNGGKVTVKRFDGLHWQIVGTLGFSTGAANYLSLVINSGTLYLAYTDGSNGNKATVKKFDGNSWVTIGTEGFSRGSATNTLLTFNSNTPYISYIDGSNGNKATVKKFDGSSWVTVGIEGFSTTTTTNLSLVFNGSIPYVAYIDYAYNGGRVTVKRFDGSSWVTVGTEGFSVGRANNLSIGFISNIPYVAFNDSNDRGYAKVMRFSGTSWVLVGTPDSVAGANNYVLFAFNSGTFYAAYSDPANNSKLTVKRFDGNYWQTVGSLGFTAGQVNYTSLGFNGNVPYISYADASNGNKAFVRKFDGSSWVSVGLSSSGLTPGPPSLAFSGSTPYIAYSDRSNGGKATVKKYDGNNWVAIGTEGFTSGFVDQVSLAVDNGTPYIFYGDVLNNFGTAAVMKFDGNSWVKVGASGFTQTSVTYPSIKINNGIPYVVYQAGTSNGGTIVVKQFNGTDWVTVGSNIATNSNYPSLAFNGNTPYVIYADGPPSVTFESQARATVKKFDGTNWQTIGGARFSSVRIIYPSIVFNGNTPYISYSDFSDGRATVQKFDGTRWVTVNTSGFLSTSPNSPSSISLAMVGDTPYAAYQDGGNGSRAKVSRFDGNNWITVGEPSVSAEAVRSTNLMFNNNKLYLTYSSGGVYVKYFDLPISTNAQLSNLALSSGTLAPVFAPDSTTYTVSTPNTTKSITLTPTAADASTTITVNGTAVSSGTASAAIPLDIGSNIIKTVVTAQDGTIQKTYTLTVNRAKTPQTITFATLAEEAYGDADFTPIATSDNSTIPITYSSSNPSVAIIVNGKIHVISAGTTNITASQAGDNSFLAAVDVTKKLTVNKALLTITANNQTKAYGVTNPVLTVTYNGFVNGDTQDSLTTKPTVNTTVTAASAPGTYAITVTGAASANYNFTYVNGILIIGQTVQTITFATLPAKTYGEADFTLSAGSSAGLPVAYASSNPTVATVSAAGTVHILSAGTANITASQAGDENYNSATDVVQKLTVNKASLTITANNQTKTYGTANPALTVNYSGFVGGDTPSVITAAPSLSTTATTTSDAGTYSITVTDAVAANYSFTYVSGTLTVTRVTQAITFATVPAKAYGDADFTPAATSTSGLPITYSSSNTSVLSVVNGKLHVVGAGTATITANQTGNVNYLPAAPVSQDIAVIFTLPANNFTISATGESCKNSSNGEINISAASNLNYTATIVSGGVSTPYPFTTKLSVKNLPAGTYPVCITVAAYPAFKQCFDVTVTAPKDLSVYSVVNPALGTLSLNLTGSNSYNINLNGASFTTTKSTISLPLAPGKNTFSVTTANICQGVYEKTIDLPVKITAFPNPFENRLSLSLANEHSSTATGEVYNMQGKMVYRGKSSVSQGICSFDLSTLMPGSYVLKLVLEHSETNIKIIKK